MAIATFATLINIGALDKRRMALWSGWSLGILIACKKGKKLHLLHRFYAYVPWKLF